MGGLGTRSVEDPPGLPLFAVHIDLKNALWSFRLLPGAWRIFRFQRGLGLVALEL